MSSCSNILHIIELLFMMPFSNAKLERMFSQMNQVKTNFHNWLGQKRLETLLQIGEEDPEIKDLDPDCYISMWYQDKVRGVSAVKPHNYPKKRKSSSASNGNMNIADLMLSDLEDDDEKFFEGFEIFM